MKTSAEARLLLAELREGAQVVVKDGPALSVIPADHLAGISELARQLEVPTPTAASWHQRRDRTAFPDPVLTIRGTGPVFDMVAVRDWYDGWRDWAGPAITPEGHVT